MRYHSLGRIPAKRHVQYRDPDSSGNGTVRVLVTDAWNMVPEAGQRSYTNALFGRWRAAAGGLGTVRVQVVDPGGTVVSEKSEP